MKKIININLSGRLIPIEDTAYDQLQNYLDSLKRYFSREQGGDEIVSDIESRIAELFQDSLKKGAHCITDQDVAAVIASIGRPEQLADEPAAQAAPIDGGSQGSPRHTGKRLTRNENDKILGGVCSGIADYFSIDPVITRILFVVFTVAWGSGILIYVVLWALLPGTRIKPYKVRHKRLYRDPEHRVVAGVCSGIGSYLNLDPYIVRLIFALPLIGIVFFSIMHEIFRPAFLFSFSVGSFPTLILIYIILWIAVPKAVTVTEKLEMRGERVDLQNISNAVKEASTEDEKRPEPGVSGSTTPGPAPTVPPSAEYHPYYYPPFPRRRGTALGDIILLIFKIFAFIILGIILVALCIALITVVGAFLGVAGFSSVALPDKNLILTTPLQHELIWPAIYLTLGIPVVAIIWFFIRLITGFKSRRRIVGPVLGLLWFIGIVCSVILVCSIVRDFQMNYRVTEPIVLSQPSHGKLIIREADERVRISGFHWFDNLNISDDTLIGNDIQLDIEKSPNDSFQVAIEKGSNGRSVSMAREYANNIGYTPYQDDSILYLPSGYSIPMYNAYRGQRIRMKFYIPIGKEVRLENSFDGVNWDINEEDAYSNSWDIGIDYLMTPSGLKNINLVDTTAQPLPEEPKTKIHPQKQHAPYRYKYPSAKPVNDSSQAPTAVNISQVSDNADLASVGLFDLSVN